MSIHIPFVIEGDFDHCHAQVGFGLIIISLRLPQIRLSFSGLAHPFVFLATPVIRDEIPQEYLVLAPLGEEEVYLLPSRDEHFDLETAILLRVKRTGGLIEAEVEQQGHIVQDLEVVLWEHQISEDKLPAQTIELRREEGTPGDLARLTRRPDSNIWKEANQQLAEWAKTAPLDGSFHSVQYVVDYGERQDKFMGTYHLRAHDASLANLGRTLRAWTARYTGRWFVPVSPADPKYSASEMNRLAAEHEKEMEKVGLQHGWTQRYIQLFSHKELLDDFSVEPMK